MIAYTPIPFYETPERRARPQPLPAEEFWSVALVAPIEEVSGLIGSLNVRQFLLIGIFQSLIVFGTGLLIFISSRWSSTLASEVDRKDRGTEKISGEIDPLRAPGGRGVHGQPCVP